MHGEHRFPVECELLDSGTHGPLIASLIPVGTRRIWEVNDISLLSPESFCSLFAPRELVCMGIVQRIISWAAFLLSLLIKMHHLRVVVSQ